MIQLTFDDLIFEDKFSNNGKINLLVDDIDNLVSKAKISLPNLTRVNKKYEVWKHVPNLGERLSYGIYFDCDFVNIVEKYCGVGATKIHDVFDFESLRERHKEFEITVSFTPTFFLITTLEKR